MGNFKNVGIRQRHLRRNPSDVVCHQMYSRLCCILQELEDMKNQARLARFLSSERDKSRVAGYIGEIRDLITEFQLSVQLEGLSVQAESHSAIEVSG